MGDIGDLFNDIKEEKKEKRAKNATSSRDILISRKVPFKELSSDHLRVAEYDFWPSTGLFIHIKTKKRGRGVFNLIKILGC